ncbi:MAG: Chemotaxis protein methyltransferase Cher2 [Alphaproteobacteria bacterium ADurb.Bin438]|nr:MAG: Chemotaxis protein methyltransferase Cher2 [Alphaproteobacteria bacterium ADurb.Bin438]
MRDDDFDFISRLLKEQSGLVLTKDKVYLLESRLLPIARSNNFVTLEDLIMALKSKPQKLVSQVVEAMTTNESFFFRDIKPFEQFEKIVLPYLIKTRANKRSIRIWSAACSSGQEAYSLCMILKEKAKELAGFNIEIVATDLSTDILNKAMAGVYSQFEVQRGLPIQLLVKYFKKDGDSWTIDRSIISMVQFKKWNLLDDIKALGHFDVVFCRNVLIYFDQATKSVILEKMYNQMPKDGFLYLGGAETVLGICDKYRPVVGQRGIYVANVNETRIIDDFAKDGDLSKISSPSGASFSSIPAMPPMSGFPKPTSNVSSASSPSPSLGQGGSGVATTNKFATTPSQPTKPATNPSSFSSTTLNNTPKSVGIASSSSPGSSSSSNTTTSSFAAKPATSTQTTTTPSTASTFASQQPKKDVSGTQGMVNSISSRLAEAMAPLQGISKPTTTPVSSSTASSFTPSKPLNTPTSTTPLSGQTPVQSQTVSKPAQTTTVNTANSQGSSPSISSIFASLKASQEKVAQAAAHSGSTSNTVSGSTGQTGNNNKSS